MIMPAASMPRDGVCVSVIEGTHAYPTSPSRRRLLWPVSLPTSKRPETVSQGENY